MPKTPTKLGDYKLTRRISDGAQAAVYEATSTSGEIVALKLFKNTGEDEASEMRFKREAEILRKLSHRNIVRYRDSFSTEGDWDQQQNCVVMEYMKGHTLKERMLAFPKGMPWENASDVLKQCLDGLLFASRKHGITHRDIKPSNIFILDDEHVRLFDFGIARMDGSATATGGSACMGSFDYMAPDFALADKSTASGSSGFRGDELSDIFSLTLCFYEMLTGRLPWHKFGERPELEYLARWQPGHMKPPSHSPIAFRVIQHLTSFIDKGLDPDRTRRYQGYDEMLDALAGLRHRTIRHKGKEKYTLLEGLDKGGFGEVYKAQRAGDGRVVAVKRLFADRASRRFVKEADILRRYRHPHLVEYMDSFQTTSPSGDKQLFLVMEFLDGMPQWSLRYRIRDKSDPLDVGEVLELFRYYLEALQYLHENVNQIIHRDIKPGNLYAPKDNTAHAKILDLGIARDVSGTQTHGATPGTWDYMAPEFVTEHARGSPQSDLYALGLSLYEAVSRKPAFPRSSKSGHEAAADFIARASGSSKISIDYSQKVFKAHPELEGIVRKATRNDTKHRFASASEMRVEVMRVMQNIGKLGGSALDENAADSDATSDTMSVQTRNVPADALKDKTRASEDWKQWVAAEKSRLSSRRLLLVALSALTMIMLVSTVVITVSKRKAANAKRRAVERAAGITPISGTARNTAAVVTKTPATPNVDTSAGKPVTSPPSAEVVPEHIESKPARRKDRGLAQDLVKHLRLLRMRNIVASSYSGFADDAAARADNARLIVSQPEYDEVRDSREVKNEERRLWHHIAENAVNRYINTKDGRFLAAGRGALHAATPLYAGSRNSQLFSSILTEWSQLSETIRFSKYLPLPQAGQLTVVNAKSGYLETLLRSDEFSTTTAAMLPHVVTIRANVTLSRGRSRSLAQKLVLVPNGRSPVGEVLHPFYLAAEETTHGAMRTYRDGAKEDLKKDSRLRRHFTGRVSGPALGQNEDPYELPNISEAIEFCNWLSHRQGITPVYRREGDAWISDFSADGVRLPTGVEWEYAARFGLDWHTAPNQSSWTQIRRQLDDSHPDALVWFYYKKRPRSSAAAHRTPYPLGMFDMCGNMGELCMGSTRWRSMDSDAAGMHVRGGNYKNRTTRKVLPNASEPYGSAEHVGFRVVLPVRVASFVK